MERITISVDESLLAAFDGYMRTHGYRNRSEAFRDLVRERLASTDLARPDAGHCIACLSYVYDHNKRQLARRLIEAQHAHHDLGVTTMHVHLDHDNCMESVILKGPVASVKEFADSTAAASGVRHANLNIVQIDVDVEEHRHEGGDKPNVRLEPHTHAHPRR